MRRNRSVGASWTCCFVPVRPHAGCRVRRLPITGFPLVCYCQTARCGAFPSGGRTASTRGGRTSSEPAGRVSSPQALTPYRACASPIGLALAHLLCRPRSQTPLRAASPGHRMVLLHDTRSTVGRGPARPAAAPHHERSVPATPRRASSALAGVFARCASMMLCW